MARTFEIVSSGIDEFLQGIGGDPWGGASAFGLRVPTLATPDKDHRYLFVGATFSIAEGASARIRGYRQFSSLGTLLSPTRFIEQEILSPNFRLPDGNISWALRRLGPPNAAGFPRGPAPGDLDSFTRGFPSWAALMYDSYAIPAGDRYYTQLTAYTPPALGRPWGTPIRNGLQGNFFDQRTPYRDAHGWSSLDVEVHGPETVAFFISVRQSAGDYAVAGVPTYPNALGVEESFIGNFGGGDAGPRPIYWRVGCSLVVEM